MEDHRPILIHALEVDVKIQKVLHTIVVHIHKNLNPDYVWLERTMAEMKAWVDEWLGIRVAFGDSLQDIDVEADAYFKTVEMELIPPALERIVQKVRIRIADGELPEYKGEAVKALVYDLDFYHNAATFVLARKLGVSLA